MWFEGLQLLVVVAALGLTAWQIRVQRVRQVEDFYLQRYWDLMDQLSEAALTCRLNANQAEETDRRTIRLYFRLSEDEADGRANGWISKATWQTWCGAMLKRMEHEPYESLWKQALADSDAELDYKFQHLRKIKECGESYDPRPANRFSARLLARVRGMGWVNDAAAGVGWLRTRGLRISGGYQRQRRK